MLPPGDDASAEHGPEARSRSRLAQRSNDLLGQTRSHVADSRFCCDESRSLLEEGLDAAAPTRGDT